MSDAQLGIDTGNLLWSEGVRNLATITESTDYAEGVRRTSVAQFEKRGGTLVAEERYASDVTDFRTQLTKLLNANPDAIHLAAQSEFTGDPANSKAQDVLKNFREKYDYVTLPWYLGSAYDDVYITAECLKQTKDDQDADGFRDCLYEITWSGAIGDNYSFDSNGEVVGLANVVVEVLPTGERTEDNQGYQVLGPAPLE